MTIYWNWTAALAPATSMLVFAGSLVIQNVWTHATAKKLAEWSAVGGKGRPLTGDQVTKYQNHFFEVLSLDADRLQLFVTLLTVPLTVYPIFKIPAIYVPILTLVFIVSLVVLFVILSIVDEKGNRLSPLFSWVSFWTAAGLVFYLVVVFLFTPPGLTI